jgi:hypothetical protein
VKLHLGSGAVYLLDWWNVDIQAPKTFLARERPDLVERWKTTEDGYYARHADKTIDTLRTGPLDQEYVCDSYGDFLSIPVATYECQELLARQVFEHLSLREARQALNECLRVLRRGGVLRLDVPDHEETLRLYKQTGDEFYVRHLLGPRRNEWGFHMMSYDRPRLRALVEDHGFRFTGEEPNVHFFPAFTLRFVRL